MQERDEGPLALLERHPMQVVAIQVDQVKSVVKDVNIRLRRETAMAIAETGALLHQAERRSSMLVERNNFSIENGGFCVHKFRHIVQLAVLRGQIILVAGHEPETTVIDEGDGTIP